MTETLSRKIRSANVLMTLCIVALHATGDKEPRLIPVGIATDFAVPVFFTISAFLYFQGWQPTWECYTQKLRKRLLSLYLPFVCYNVIFACYLYAKSEWLHFPTNKQLPDNGWELLSSILTGWPMMPDGVLWFVRCLLFFALGAPLLAFVVRKGRWTLLPLTVAGFLLARLSNYESVLYWLPCFALGAFCAFFETDVRRWLTPLHSDKRKKWGVTAAFALYIVVVPVMLCNVAYHSLPYYTYRIVAPLWIMALYAAHDDLLPRRLTDALAPFTFFFYCMHTAFLDVARHFIEPLLPSSLFVVTFLLLTATTVVTLWLAGSLLRRQPLIWQLLTGFRNNTQHPSPNT